jgi:hypothetical protein
MTTMLPPPRHSVYQLSEDLRDESLVLGVRQAAPSEADREELLIEKLGAKGWGRIHHFRNYYSSGWGDGAGQPLSPRALESLFLFLEKAHFAMSPSVFLTDRGGIELCWENTPGNSIQVEFTREGVEFYKSATKEEGWIPLEKLARLSGMLSKEN